MNVVADVNTGGIGVHHLQAQVFALHLPHHFPPLLAVHLSPLARVWAHHGFLPSTLAGFLHWFAFHAVLHCLIQPGSARAAKLTQSPHRGQALFLIQDKPATIFTIAKTGAMLFVGQICSRETTALAVEPSCGSDSKSRATLRSSTSLGKTLQACRETQGEFQGHTITPLGVTGAFCRHRF